MFVKFKASYWWCWNLRRYTWSLCRWILGDFQYVSTANSASEWLVKCDSYLVNCSIFINIRYFLLAKDGKIGFYYKEHEILPPLPGEGTPKIHLHWNNTSWFVSHIMRRLWTHNFQARSSVGFHRYILDNFIGDSADGVVEREIEEFDPPSEVSGLVLKIHSHLNSGWA